MEALLTVLSRWIHVITACIIVGGVFFLWVILPRGLAILDEAQRIGVTAQLRRVFKVVVHSAILLLIITGTYNTIMNWDAYRRAVPMSHALLGVHLLLGLAIFAISIILMLGKEPHRRHRALLGTNLVLLVLTVAVASSLKYVRDSAPPRTQATVTR